MSSGSPPKVNISHSPPSAHNYCVSDGIVRTWNGAKLAWHGVELNAMKLPGTVPLTHNHLKNLITFVNRILENSYAVSLIRLLEGVGQRLEMVTNMWRSFGKDWVPFWNVLTNTEDELKQMDRQVTLKHMFQSNKQLKRLEDIFQRLDEATKTLQLKLAVVTPRKESIVQNTEILRIDNLKPCREARYAHVAHQLCVEGTRNAIIQDIMSWSRDDSSDCPPVYWLSGMEGTGKSTIAYTICEKLYDHGDKFRRLGASFFCSKQLEGARLRQNVIPTIAHDIAHRFPNFRRALLALNLDSQPPPLKDHIRSLLSEPWRSATTNQAPPPWVVVIDALDELEAGEGSLVLDALTEEVFYKRELQGLKFLVTSRQDSCVVKNLSPVDREGPHIVAVFPSVALRGVLGGRLGDSAVGKHDIYVYLCTACPSLDPAQLRILANQSSGLFTSAVRFVRFIVSPPRFRPTPDQQVERLNILLETCYKHGIDSLWVDRLLDERFPDVFPDSESIDKQGSKTLPSSSFHGTWKSLSSTPSIDQLQAIIVNRSSKPWKTVEDLHPDSFQFVIDEIQLILNRRPQVDPTFRTTAIKCLQALTTLSGYLPTSMIIEHADSEDIPRYGGAYADIYFGQAGPTKIAVKVIRLFCSGSDEEYSQHLAVFRREALLWYQLRHPRILSLLGVNMTVFAGRPCLISPLMENGNTNQFLAKHPEHNRLRMMTEIMEGIHFLHTHSPPLVHADIRGANILVKDDLTCCLADFGLSVVCDSLVTTSRTRGGTMRWLAPEIMKLSPNDQGVLGSDLTRRDIYAFGCTAVEICSGTRPFPKIPTEVGVLNAVLTWKRTPVLPQTPFLPQEAHALVFRCLAYEAEGRPDAAEVLECLQSCC